MERRQRSEQFFREAIDCLVVSGTFIKGIEPVSHPAHLSFEVGQITKAWFEQEQLPDLLACAVEVAVRPGAVNTADYRHCRKEGSLQIAGWAQAQRGEMIHHLPQGQELVAQLLLRLQGSP